ncbi:MAG: DUF4388 domain-containing protein [Acidimicrobiales bacterium]
MTGSLAETSLPDVLRALEAEQATGVLQIGQASEVWLEAGKVYLAHTPSSPPLDAVLFGADAATADEITAALAAGTAAATLAAADDGAAPTYERLLHEYNLNALFEMIVPSDTEYSFVAGDVHALGGRFAEPVEELVAQADRRLDIWRQIAARIPNTSMVFHLAPNLPDEEDERVVTADEWRYLSLLDGHRSVAEVIGATGESAFRVCSSLYRMLLEGLIAERA